MFNKLGCVSIHSIDEQFANACYSMLVKLLHVFMHVKLVHDINAEGPTEIRLLIDGVAVIDEHS